MQHAAGELAGVAAHQLGPEADGVEEFDGPPVRVGGAHGAGEADALGEEVADAAQRVDGRPGVLEDHRGPAGAQFAQPGGVHGEDVPAVDEDLAGGDGAGRQQAEGGARGEGLAGAGLADQGDGLAGGDGEVDPVEHRAGGAG